MTDFTESIMTNFELFSSTFVDFEKKPEDENIPTFGKIKLNINKFPNTKKDIDFQFNIDNSGSMSSVCADGKTQMEHMNFTVEKITRYLHDHDISATVSVNSFDTQIIQLIKYQRLTAENIEEISKKIRKITPNGGTDIGKVLQMEAAFEKPRNYNHDERVFFMFTDGQAANGIVDKKQLKRISDAINPSTSIITFGCGLDHDYALLSSIASRKNSSYKFIGKLEEAAIACGEILDSILNKVLTNVEISVQHGEIYDWKTNTWKSKIETNNIVGECDKSYNIRSLTPHDFEVIITGTIVETGEPFEYLVTEKNMDQDLRKDDYRQKTLELLYEINIYNNSILMKTGETNKELKNRIKEFLKKMKAFMDEEHLRDDLFMKMLTDDLFVAYSTFGTQHGNMYTTSRQTSQATQSIHTNSCEPNLYAQVPLFQMDDDTDCEFPPPPTMTRGFTCRIQRMDEEEEEEEAARNMMYNFPSSMQNCSMHTGFGLPLPRAQLSRSHSRHVGFVDLTDKDKKEAEEDAQMFGNHKTLGSNVSPYANIKTTTVMREVSLGSADTP
jgi:hypothetical protein